MSLIPPLTTRRTFLRTSALAALVAGGGLTPWAPLRRSRSAKVGRGFSGGPPLGALPVATDPDFRTLAHRALDAATAGGARYADVRFTVTRRRTFEQGQPSDRALLAVGVRALADGPWGFAAHSDWTPERVAQLGRDAAAQARDATWPGARPIELPDHPAATTGHWATPVRRDPFAVPVADISDFLNEMYEDFGRRLKKFDDVAGGGLSRVLTFERQDRVFASTAGSYTTQTIYTALGDVPHENIPLSHIWLGIDMFVPTPTPHGAHVKYAFPWVTPTGGGYEIVEDTKVLEHEPEYVETVRELAAAVPFTQPGMYDVVFDGAAMATLLDATFGAALQYDRAVGYDGGGASVLSPPEAVLGTSRAPAMVTILGDRTLPGGAATVGWDDEGVAAQAFPLVSEGVVVDYASSREFVGGLAPWYQRRGMPVRSNGCAASDSAGSVPRVAPPNVVLQPARQDTSLEALVAGIDTGLLVCGGHVAMDERQATGRGRGAVVYAIKHGKRVGTVKDAVYRFRSQELWHNLVALGGAQTAAMRGFSSVKGDPPMETLHSARAVAAHVTRVQVLPARVA